MKIITLVSIVLISLSLKAQKSYVIQVFSKNQSPILGVNCSSSDGAVIGVSDTNGEIYLTNVNVQKVYMSHISHEEFILYFTDANIYEVILKRNRANLPEVSVNSHKLPEIVYKSEQFHASDFVFFEDGVLVLTNERNQLFKPDGLKKKVILRDCRIVKLDTNLKEQTSSKLLHEGINLYKDEYGQCFLQTLKGGFFITEVNGEIELVAVGEEFDFQTPVPLSLNENGDVKLVNNFDPTFPAFEYYLMKEDSTRLMCSIEDKVLMHTFRAQYRNLIPREKLNAYRMELKSGIEKEVISGYMTGFHNSILFEPLYAPSFLVCDSIYVFNLIEEKVMVYNLEGALQREVRTNIDQSRQRSKFQNRIIQDHITGELYAEYLDGRTGVLRRIELNSGELGKVKKLTYDYPERVEVYADEVYYLYRPFRTPQKTYLYKENLN
tara:strand:- start:12752 stop:14062 length:1311 start_codon:yes stop_codon:yes gene_type:complete